MDLLFIVVFLGSGAALILSFFSLINPRVGFGKTPAMSCGIYLAIFAALIMGMKIVMEMQKSNAIKENPSTNLSTDTQHVGDQKLNTGVITLPDKKQVGEN